MSPDCWRFGPKALLPSVWLQQISQETQTRLLEAAVLQQLTNKGVSRILRDHGNCISRDKATPFQSSRQRTSS